MKVNRKDGWTIEQDELLKINIMLPVKELCLLLNRSEGSIRTRKWTLGLKSNKRLPFSKDEKEIIKSYYENGNGVDLVELSTILGRKKTSISKIAGEMGLTKYGNFTDEERNRRAAFVLDNNIHRLSKRCLGYKFSDESKQKMSETRKINATKISKEMWHERAMKAVETRRKNGGFATTSNAYSRCKGGFRDDLNHYFRSSWEANVARILNYFETVWKYEFKRFEFEEEVSFILSYQPDFYLPELNKWIEVKGWMDEKSIERLRLFEKYYPKEYENLILIDSKCYYSLEKDFKDIVKNWEFASNYFKRKAV